MKRQALLIGIFLACTAFVAPVAAQQPPLPEPTADPSAPPAVGAAAAILADLDSGEILYDKRAHERRAPASLTKMVTALVARDRYALDEEVLVAPGVAQATGSKLGLEPGMQFPVRELLYALLLKSGNDVGVALAAHHPLGYDHFMQLMNEKARALGAYDSNFVNPHGLDAEGHHSTAWDMAIFGRQLLEDPVLADIVSTPSYSMNWPLAGGVRSFDNHNKLLQRYDGTVGVKTGFTNQARRCLVAAADLETGRVLSVVMGADDHYADTTALFDYAKARRIIEPATAPLEEGSSAQDEAFLALPPEPPAADPAPAAASDLAGDGFRTAALMALLGALMLATLVRGRRPSPVGEAAEYLGFLEPLLSEPTAPEAARRPRRATANAASPRSRR